MLRWPALFLTGISFLVMAMLVVAAGRPTMRIQRVAVEGTLLKVLALDGEAVEPARRAELRESLLAARTEEARAAARGWRLWETPDAADQAWHDAVRGAWYQARAVALKQEELGATWARDREHAERRLAQVRGRAPRLGGKVGVAALTAAESSFNLAQRWAAQGRLELASAAAAESVEHLDRFEAVWANAHSRFDEPANRRRWAGWVEATLEASRRQRSAVIVVDKLRRKVEVYDRGARVAVFDAEIGSGGLEAKLRSGDKATPEGRYKVTEKRGRGATRYYKALMLDYPNADDRARFQRAQRSGQIPKNARIGGLIEIHGQGGQGLDWTDGCVALRDSDMDRVFELVKIGTPVTIVGTVP